MGWGRMSDARRPKNDDRVPDDDGEDGRCPLLETATRVRVGRGMGHHETQAAKEGWEQGKQRTVHPDSPPPFVSAGWAGHREALLDGYGKVPPYPGPGRPPTHQPPSPDWPSPPMVKHRDAQGHLQAVEIRIIYGKAQTWALTGKRPA